MRLASIAGTAASRRTRMLSCQVCTHPKPNVPIFATIFRGVEVFVCEACRDRLLALMPTKSTTVH